VTDTRPPAPESGAEAEPGAAEAPAPSAAAPAPDASEPRALSRQGEDRKAMLLRHAEALFEERGYADTRMIDIARRAGVAKGLCYWYFESKEALFYEVILDMRERLREAQRAATEPLDDPLAIIYVGTVTSVRFIAEHSRLYGLMNNALGTPVLAGAVNESMIVHAQDTASVLRDGQALGLVRADEDPESLAFGNGGVVNNAVLLHATGIISSDVDKVAHFAARYVLHAVATNPALVAAVTTKHDPRR
jgi:AcrR family transcriptional regulator